MLRAAKRGGAVLCARTVAGVLNLTTMAAESVLKEGCLPSLWNVPGDTRGVSTLSGL